MLHIGDKIVSTMSNRGCSPWFKYNDFAEGTLGVIVGFLPRILYFGRTEVNIHKRKPGTYLGRGQALVWLNNGRVFSPGDDCFRTITDASKQSDDLIYIGDLPETKFWEMDEVGIKLPNKSHSLTGGIRSIRYYEYLSDDCDQGREISWAESMVPMVRNLDPKPKYEVIFNNHQTTVVEESWIENLISRGPAWNRHYDRPLDFKNIQDEAWFFHLIGQTSEVKNPVDMMWHSVEEVRDAIKNGIAHAFSAEMSPLGGAGDNMMIRAVFFHDKELAQRVALETLKKGYVMPWG